MEWLAEKLQAIPGVVAVTLGGSRARGEQRPDSDWDFGLYYRGRLDADNLRALDYPGTVVDPGEWGRLMNGGAWWTVDRVRVDVLYRDLDVVQHWTRQAEQGLFEVDDLLGYLAGFPTYAVVGELAPGSSSPAPPSPNPDFPSNSSSAHHGTGDGARRSTATTPNSPPSGATAARPPHYSPAPTWKKRTHELQNAENGSSTRKVS